MAKPQALGSTDLHPDRTRTRQRGVVPSAELVPIQFRMPAAWVKAFKQAALDRDLKLNELLTVVFAAFMKTGPENRKPLSISDE